VGQNKTDRQRVNPENLSAPTAAPVEAAGFFCCVVHAALLLAALLGRSKAAVVPAMLNLVGVIADGFFWNNLCARVTAAMARFAAAADLSAARAELSRLAGHTGPPQPG